MHIKVPELALVVVTGTPESARLDFCARNFKESELLDDIHNLSSRLEAGGLTVYSQSELAATERIELLKRASENDVDCVAILLDTQKRTVSQRARQHSTLKDDGFRHAYVLTSLEQIGQTDIERLPLSCNLGEQTGPFDIIGDVHGCIDELDMLLQKLGYDICPESGYRIIHPDGRQIVFLGDLVDRGPDAPAVLRLVMAAVNSGRGFCVPGNHDAKLLRHLNGHKVSITHGLKETLEQFEVQPTEFKLAVQDFLDPLPSHLILDGGKLVVAHAGIKESYQGRSSGRIRAFCHYGDTNGETDSFGLPVRYNWALDYSGEAMVVYGHTPVQNASWLNKTICIDTGCVFGGKLTALRYPSKEVVSVPANKTYYDTPRPFLNSPAWGSANPRNPR